ncbi:Hypothetical protein CINCED_3A020639 [Cinara cedri]|uniref:Ubiquitin-like domain-containing protein n=1 Tax=Cinara cedri TaxID=506608 RepID=A0A5E4MDM5_9HEMI|nr:Hypothetical protein CINCED_3A020639 [Cinara cedri]
MSSVKWFDGDSVQALQKVQDENCVFFAYIDKVNTKCSDIFYEPDIIQLLNNEIIVCFKMEPNSPSYANFNKIFNHITIPSIYVLEKNNVEQFNIKLKKSKLLKSNEVKLDFLDLKIKLLNAIYSAVKNISDSLEDKEKYFQFMTNVSDKLQNMIVQRKEAIGGVQNLIKYTKIKIKVPCLNITIVKEFETTDTLNEVKMFVLENITIPKGPIKFISERQFTDEDFNLTLSALNLCPTSTIYVHKVCLLIIVIVLLYFVVFMYTHEYAGCPGHIA